MYAMRISFAIRTVAPPYMAMDESYTSYTVELICIYHIPHILESTCMTMEVLLKAYTVELISRP